MSAHSQGGTSVSRYLTYHEVVPTVARYLYSVSTTQFAQHATRIAQMNSSKALATDPVRVTFDDGHISQFEYALPILESSTLKAIFFVTPGWTGTRDGYMSWAQLSELSAMGHEVQSHGWSHALLTQCSDSELENELTRSKKELESHLGKTVDAISAPGGRWNPSVLKACAKAGYRRVFLSDPWLLHKEKLGAHAAGRWMVTHHMDADKINKLLEGKGLELQILRAKHLVKETAKAVLGDRIYQSLWRRLSRKQESLEDTKGKTSSVSVQTSPK